MRSGRICLGLQSLQLPALITLRIIKRTCRFAHLATMQQIWSLVVTVKQVNDPKKDEQRQRAGAK
jgi:hypothetical protein